METITLNAQNSIDKDFVDNHSDYEQYALLYSYTLSKVYSGNTANGKGHTEEVWIDKYISISANGKRVYRKSQSRNGVNQNSIKLGSRTWKELGLDKIQDKTVCVRPASFIAYYLNNSNRHIKATTWIGLIGAILTVISAIITIASLFVKFPLI